MHKNIGPILVILLITICYGLSQYFKQKNVQDLSAFQRELVRSNRFYTYCLLCFPAILFVQTFIGEITRIIGISLQPTLFDSEFVLTNKFAYSIRLPMIGTQLTAFKSPKRGDIVLICAAPRNLKKRIIGLPGDHIQYSQQQLTVNGKRVPQCIIRTQRYIGKSSRNSRPFFCSLREENLVGYKHLILHYIDADTHIKGFQFQEEFRANQLRSITVTVPAGHYFVMGDNRDLSKDSRHFGCVPADHLLGQSKWILFSWNSQASWNKPLEWIRWERIGKKIV